jgi:type III restriction enzyme
MDYQNPQPKVTVFNHDAWSSSIKDLVYEVLEIETRFESRILTESHRSNYNFKVHNLDYEKEEREIEHSTNDNRDYSSIWENGISLESQVETRSVETDYENINNNEISTVTYNLKKLTVNIDEVVNKIHRVLKTADWEGKIIGLGEEVYSKEHLPDTDSLRKLIKKSMVKVGIDGDELTEENARKIYSAFSILFRKNGKTVVYKKKNNNLLSISTTDMGISFHSLSNFKKDSTMILSDDFESEIFNEKNLELIKEFTEDEDLPKKSLYKVNKALLKTPLDITFADSDPERKFIKKITKKNIAETITAWVKSRDRNFYSIEYSITIKSHTKQMKFNPDFFIKCKKPEFTYIFVVEIKSDFDDSAINRAKYKHSKLHFTNLNKELKKNNISEKYIFHFLSPNSYDAFFEFLSNNKYVSDSEKFKSNLEILLESDL